MKKLAFAITIAGIFILLIFLNFKSPVNIDNSSELSLLTENTKVKTTGKVVSEKQYGDFKILKLDNNIEITCQPCPKALNRTFTIIGTSTSYLNRTQITALTLIPSD